MEMRSKCPIACSLDLFGDKWTLLVLRDILFLEKTRFEQFLDSPEKIATNILTDRLHKLEKAGVAFGDSGDNLVSCPPGHNGHPRFRPDAIDRDEFLKQFQLFKSLEPVQIVDVLANMLVYEKV